MIDESKNREWVDMFGNIVQHTSAEIEGRLMFVDDAITGIHYMYDHYGKICQKLQDRAEGGQEFKYKRFPLIALIEDFRVRPVLGTKGRATLQFLILYHTQAEAYSEDRQQQVFKPILYPILDEFKRQIVQSGYFLITDESALSADIVDRPHWGDPGVYGNTGYILNDVLDGIEIRNVELTAY